MTTSPIFEKFTLPSKGLIYENPIPANISLRSMTTMEEMRRLTPSDMPYKSMSDIIESCMETPPAIHVYNMSLSDYQFLLHKLRIVTYGTEYKMLVKCKACGEMHETVANLDTLPLSEWDESVIDMMNITLPKSNSEVQLRFQTPRDLDIIAYKNDQMRKRTKQPIDYTIMYTLMSLIGKVDGRTLGEIELEEFVKNLQNKDANFILNKSTALNNKIGLENKIEVTCGKCGAKAVVPFRITSEFFGPTND